MRPLPTGPSETTREEGRRRALEELSDPVYGKHEPSLLDRIQAWISDFLANLIQAGEGVFGGWWLLGALLIVLGALVIALLLWLRPSRDHRVGVPVHREERLSAEAHRAAAERHEAAGEFAEAVTEYLRAISVDLEERAILTPRAGRTATELATEASRSLPEQAEALSEGAELFNDVAYGDRVATERSARTLRELNLRLRSARPRIPEEETR